MKKQKRIKAWALADNGDLQIKTVSETREEAKDHISDERDKIVRVEIRILK